MQNLDLDEIIDVTTIVSEHVSLGVDYNLAKLESLYKKMSKETRYKGIAYRIIFLTDLNDLKLEVDFNRSWTTDLKSALAFLHERRKECFRQTAFIFKAKIEGILVNEIINKSDFVDEIKSFSSENEIIAIDIAPGSFRLVKEICD